MTSSVVERYLQLGLRIGRHVDGMVDAYYGPPELAAAVAAEPLTDPTELVDAADHLLATLEDGWLRDQLVGLQTYARVLAGEPLSYADEVEGCYGVMPVRTDEAVFEAAHEDLASLLTGNGTPTERFARWEESMRVPPDRIGDITRAAIEAARAWTRQLVDLPSGEDVEVEIVHDVPWMAFCEYRGGLRSHVAVNAALPLAGPELLVIAMHETYPGHHTERALKEHLLVRGEGRLEETLAMVPTPQSLVSEGIASIAPRRVLESDGAQAMAAVLRQAGLDLDLTHAVAVGLAHEPCRWAEVNAALMLHEDGASETAAQAYLERWALLTPEHAAHVIRFLKEPTSRSYIVTYPAGRELCEAYVAGESARFRRLLTEQVRVRDLLAARDTTTRAA